MSPANLPIPPRARERGILFSAPMVRALLAGTKTQTRRVIKLPPAPAHLGQWEPFLFGGAGCRDSRGNEVSGRWTISHTRTGAVIGCKHGVGDRLWVRETWADLSVTTRGDYTGTAYRADDCDYGNEDEPITREMIRWRPSIHMPRVASRITLEVTGVRVERLKEISDADCVAEGIERRGPGWRWYTDRKAYTSQPVTSYRSLWESINGADSWDASPWVWVVEFKPA